MQSLFSSLEALGDVLKYEKRNAHEDREQIYVSKGKGIATFLFMVTKFE